MTPDALKFFWSVAGGFGMGALVAVGIGYCIVAFYLPSYLAEKGKNLATKEDVGELTRIVEEVKQQNALAIESAKAEHQRSLAAMSEQLRAGNAEILEQTKSKHQLRIAAIDRRLEAHQEAFVLLRELVAEAHGEKVNATIMKCQAWWERNCLYLEPEARSAFSLAYLAAGSHKSHLQALGFHGARPDVVKGVEDNWNRIISALDVVMTSVALPGLTESEKAGTPGRPTGKGPEPESLG